VPVRPPSAAASAPRRRSRLRRMLSAGAAIAMLPSFAVVAVLGPTSPATAAPGTPGTPSAPTVLFQEDFQQGAAITTLPTYASSSGTTYTADPFWLDTSACNGFVVSSANVFPGGALCGGRATEFASLTAKTSALGLLNTPQNSSTNRALAGATTTSGTPGRMLASSQIALPSGSRFLTMSLDAAATGCGVSAPQLGMSLANAAGVESAVNAGTLNPCTDTRHLTTTIGGDVVAYGRFVANSSVLANGGTVGLVVRNQQGAGNGNDTALDNVRLLDVTPQLDIAFAPTTVTAGGTSTLTLTITNTSELAAKNGWAFTDGLPAGLVIAPSPNLGGTCPATVTAGAGAGTLGVTAGRLAAGVTSCTITVAVTSATPAPGDPPVTYRNCAADFTGVVGIGLPACAQVTFTAAAFTCAPVPIWANTADRLISYSGTTFAELSNVPLAREYGDIAWSTDGSRLFAVDYDAGTGVIPDLRQIDPATGAELSVRPLTGPMLTQTTMPGQTAYSANALTALDASTLLVGSYSSRDIYRLDIATGQTTLWTQFPATISSAGDFFQLPDGDVLAFGVQGSGDITTSLAYRIHPDGSLTFVGTLPRMHGGAQSGGYVYMVTPTGDLSRVAVADIPTTNVGAFPVTVVRSGGPAYYGASSVQDASACVGLQVTKTPTPTTITGVGQTVTYSFTVSNISDVAVQGIVLTDVQRQPAGPLTAGPSCPLTALAAHTSMVCTGSYVSTQADVDHGRIDDTASAAGRTASGLTVLSNTAEATVQVVPITRWSLAKSASLGAAALTEGAVVQPGDTITYRVTATSAATIDLPGTVLRDDLSGVLGSATFVAGSATLTVGAGASVAVADPVGGVLTVGPFTLPAGAAAVVVYRVTVGADAWSATLHNTVSGSGSAVAPDPCASTCSTTQVTPAVLQVQKVGEDSDAVVVPMDGSAWAVYGAATGGSAIVGSVAPATDAGGATITGLFRDTTLLPGTYWLEETRASPGFALLAGRVGFTISATGTIQLTAGSPSNVSLVTVSGVPTIRVQDVPALVLPQAGGSGTAWIRILGGVLLGAGGMLAAGTALARRWRRPRMR